MNEQVQTHLNTLEGGTQDASGWGFLGLTLGTLTGFLTSFFLVVPLFPKGQGLLLITLLTTIVVVIATLGGTIGYLVTRSKRLSA